MDSFFPETAVNVAAGFVEPCFVEQCQKERFVTYIFRMFWLLIWAEDLNLFFRTEPSVLDPFQFLVANVSLVETRKTLKKSSRQVFHG